MAFLAIYMTVVCMNDKNATKNSSTILLIYSCNLNYLLILLPLSNVNMFWKLNYKRITFRN